MIYIFDCRMETMYPLGKEGFSGGSQTYVRAITEGLAAKGHTVHVITNDLEYEEQRGLTLWYWGPKMHPTMADVAVMQMHAHDQPDYEAPILVLMTSCVDPYLGPNDKWAEAIDAIPCFSDVHKDLLLQVRPSVKREKCFVTGLGVNMADYPVRLARTAKVPYRMLYANDPARGLFYALDIFDRVKTEIPDATLHVAYDFDRQLGFRQWEHSQMAQMLLDCKSRMENTPGVVNRGGLSREEIIREELETHVHCMPSDPPGLGTQTHGITQMECAAAGAALVLSDVEAFPEIFGAGATILPVMGRYIPEAERRVEPGDYSQVVIELMKDPKAWEKASKAARALASQHTWKVVLRKWEEMIEQLKGNRE